MTIIALNDKKKSSLATKIDSLSSLTLFITVIHSWMSVYPYFNRMLCVRFFFTLLYTKLTALCYRWKTITSINHPVTSRSEINLIINFLLFNAKCIHSLQNICTRYYPLYTFAPSRVAAKCDVDNANSVAWSRYGNSYITLYTAPSTFASFNRS